jgi:hypothetical protein
MSIYQSPDRPDSMMPTHDVPMRHAFVIIGERTLFLSHLASWWMEGHNWELVLRITVPEAARKKIINDRHDEEPLFMVNPRTSLFTIPELIRRSWSLKPADRKFQADVWKGIGKGAKPDEPDPDWLPWDDHEPLLTKVTVKIDAVIHHRHANLNVIGKEHEDYILFGAGDEAHIYHSPTRQPDYDHVAALDRPPAWLQPEQVETGVVVSVPSVPWFPGETRCKESPLPIGQPTVVRFHGMTDYRTKRWDETAGPYRPIPRYEITVKRDWWFATDILNFVPPTFGQCI